MTVATTSLVPRVATEPKPKSNRKGGARPNAGRPKGAKDISLRARFGLQELARTYTQEALELCMDIARNSISDSARVSAISLIIDRGYGKVSQGVDLTSGGQALTIVLSKDEAEL